MKAINFLVLSYDHPTNRTKNGESVARTEMKFNRGQRLKTVGFARL